MIARAGGLRLHRYAAHAARKGGPANVEPRGNRCTQRRCIHTKRTPALAGHRPAGRPGAAGRDSSSDRLSGAYDSGARPALPRVRRSCAYGPQTGEQGCRSPPQRERCKPNSTTRSSILPTAAAAGQVRRSRNGSPTGRASRSIANAAGNICGASSTSIRLCRCAQTAAKIANTTQTGWLIGSQCAGTVSAARAKAHACTGNVRSAAHDTRTA